MQEQVLTVGVLQSRTPHVPFIVIFMDITHAAPANRHSATFTDLKPFRANPIILENRCTTVWTFSFVVIATASLVPPRLLKIMALLPELSTLIANID